MPELLTAFEEHGVAGTGGLSLDHDEPPTNDDATLCILSNALMLFALDKALAGGCVPFCLISS